MRGLAVAFLVFLVDASCYLPPQRAAPPQRSNGKILEQASELYAWGTPEDVPAVLALLGAAAEAYRRAGDFRGEAIASERLAKVHADAGSADSAIAILAPLITSSMRVNDVNTELLLRTRLALVYERSGAEESATRASREAAILANRADDTTLIRRARATYARQWALRLLGQTPLADLTMGVEQGEAYVEEVENILRLIAVSDTIGSVEEATARLEDLLENVTITASIRSDPPNATVRYRRYVDRGLPQASIRTNAEVRTQPAYYVFTLIDRQSGIAVDSIDYICRTDCTIDFGRVSP